MVGQNVLVAICSVGAGVLGFIAGLLIMFVVKSCQASDETDTEKGLPYTPRRESLPREYCSRGGVFDRRPPESVASVAPITSDGESGVYCRISKFDFPVVTEDAAIQTNEANDADYVYLVKFEQAVQCDIISACPPQSPCNQSTSSNGPENTMSYSAYRRHVMDAFSKWQILPAAAMTSQPCIEDDRGWSHHKLDKCKQTSKAAGQNEAADDSDLLVIKLTSNVRTFLYMNGLCETASSVATPITMTKTEATGDSHSSPTRQIATIQWSSHGNRTNGQSEIESTLKNSEPILETDNHYMNNEDYLPMDGESAEDYLPMKNLSEDDEYVLPEIKDNYSYLASLQRQTSSMKTNFACVKATQNTVTSLPDAYDASGRSGESQKTSPYSSGSTSECNVKQCPSECVSEDEYYLPMTTKASFVNEDYYNCSRLKEDDDDYLPIDEHTLPCGCGKTRQHSSQDSDYANYRPSAGHVDER